MPMPMLMPMPMHMPMLLQPRTPIKEIADDAGIIDVGKLKRSKQMTEMLEVGW